jgi:hypothetical protein
MKGQTKGAEMVTECGLGVMELLLEHERAAVEKLKERLAKSDPCDELYWVAQPMMEHSWRARFLEQCIRALRRENAPATMGSLYGYFSDELDRWKPQCSTNPISNVNENCKYLALKWTIRLCLGEKVSEVLVGGKRIDRKDTE